MISLSDITPENSQWTKVNKLFPGEKERFWVDYNSWWYRKSKQREDIFCQLIEFNSNIVGIVAYGQHYTDKKLTRKVENTAEIYHIVIDKEFQNCGFAFKACQNIIHNLLTTYRFNSIVIAYNKENIATKKLFEKLMFLPIATKNYDGDEMMKLEKNI